MILIDRGQLTLDTPVADIDPTWNDLQVLVDWDGDNPILRPQQGTATIRHLATHTSGLEYEIWNAEILRFMKANDASPRNSGCRAELQSYPLASDPGTRWGYGTGIDWLGQALYSTAPDYLTFLRMILNRGALNGHQVLSPGSMDTMLADQTYGLPFRTMRSAIPARSVDVTMPPGTTHSFAFVLTERDQPGKRRAGAQGWAGICNTHCWFDPAQYRSRPDDPVAALHGTCLYRNLRCLRARRLCRALKHERYRHPALAALFGLCLGMCVANGFARFAYGLILPAMREDLGWTYAQAGWLNTANALGYLTGAVVTLILITRINASLLYAFGMVTTAVSLLLTGLNEALWWQTIWRIAAGLFGAMSFATAGALAAQLFAGDPKRNALAIALLFGLGGGLGISLAGTMIPPLLITGGITAWPHAWTLIGVSSLLPRRLGRWTLRPRATAGPRTHTPLPLRQMWPELVGMAALAWAISSISPSSDHG